MSVLQAPPPGYKSLAELPSALGMSKQNLYQSGLLDWIKARFTLYQIGRTILISEGDVILINQHLGIREKLIACGELASNHPLVDERLLYPKVGE